MSRNFVLSEVDVLRLRKLLDDYDSGQLFDFARQPHRKPPLPCARDDILQIYLSSDFYISSAGTDTQVTGWSERHDHYKLGELTSNEIIPDLSGWIHFDLAVTAELDTLGGAYGHTYVWLEKYNGSTWSFLNDSMVEMVLNTATGNELSYHHSASRSFCDEVTDDTKEKYRVMSRNIPSSSSMAVHLLAQNTTTTNSARTGGTTLTMTRPLHPFL